LCSPYFADRVGFGQRWRVGDGTVTTEICTPAAGGTPQPASAP
jgi:hypothetical protein